MRLYVGIVCVYKYLFGNIVSGHCQYGTSLNQPGFHMVNMFLVGQFVVDENSKVFSIFFLVNRESIYGDVYWWRWLFVALSE